MYSIWSHWGIEIVTICILEITVVVLLAELHQQMSHAQSLGTEVGPFLPKVPPELCYIHPASPQFPGANTRKLQQRNGLNGKSEISGINGEQTYHP